ncbi:Uncharacterised protein [Flavonifractor plautii]|uniref:Uncharacterized protein n=1 Tax=Flavonifractor plautii TaxID=292800 RepID=A0A173Z8D5_FLAPL|nr:Uncharacterised protein [Flavonifractor plautii]
MAQVDPIGGHVDGGAYPVTGVPAHADVLHQLVVAGADLAAVHCGPHAPAGQLLHIGYPGGIQFLAVGLLERAGDGVVGVALRQGGQLQKLRLAAVVGMDGGDVKHAAGQSAGLVKDHEFRFGQYLQIVAALYQNTVFRGPADAAEEGQGDGDDQGAGAGDHQEVQSPLDGVHPLDGGKQGGQEGQSHGGQHHGGGVVPGELGDEVFCLGLLAGGVLHQIQNFSHSGLLKGLGDPNPQQAGQVDTAGDHIVAGLGLPGEGLAGEGRSVHIRGALQHHAVQGDALAGLDDDGVTHRHILGVYLPELTVHLNVGVVGPDIHQGGDGLAGLVYGIALEELAHLVEQHDEYGLGVFAGGQGAHSGQGHQKVFIKDLAVGDVAHGPPQDIPGNDGIGDQKGEQPQPSLRGQEKCDRKEHCAGEDAEEHSLLLLGHRTSLL